MTITLPEEILQAVVEYLAYNRSFIERQKLEFCNKYSSGQLFSLSATSRQFRRVCMPFIFSFIQIQVRSGALERLRAQCSSSPTFAGCIRTLSVISKSESGEYDSCSSHENQEHLNLLLPFLIHLSQLNLKGIDIHSSLLDAIRSHPVSTVLINSLDLPQESDLAKLVCEEVVVVQGNKTSSLDSLLARGMQVHRIIGVQPDLLKEPFGSRTFNGLRELELILGRYPVDLIWFPDMMRSHASLKKVIFNNHRGLYFKNGRNLPFMRLFLEEAEKQGCSLLDVRSFDIARAITAMPIPDPYGGWHVTGLYLRIVRGCQLETILKLAHLFFPDIDALKLSDLGYICSEDLCVDPLVNALRQFSSLRVLSLLKMFTSVDITTRRNPWGGIEDRMETDTDTSGPSTSSTTNAMSIAVEAGALWSVSCIALEIPRLEDFYFEEEGSSRISVVHSRVG
ncbi:hypothetical protein D9757_009440 [Collybiopsis confluens]|uniref:Uncharacterized protein n=1 Tax=Collybiopsis confluens TaxID=2823264 RepID=A0A8H5M567_9AGAR|nr:hypothetical protein D9757_009440 [Collybiopsis confluens]